MIYLISKLKQIQTIQLTQMIMIVMHLIYSLNVDESSVLYTEINAIAMQTTALSIL